jgi:hypothetical protein
MKMLWYPDLEYVKSLKLSEAYYYLSRIIG